MIFTWHPDRLKINSALVIVALVSAFPTAIYSSDYSVKKEKESSNFSVTSNEKEIESLSYIQVNVLRPSTITLEGNSIQSKKADNELPAVSVNANTYKSWYALATGSDTSYGPGETVPRTPSTVKIEYHVQLSVNTESQLAALKLIGIESARVGENDLLLPHKIYKKLNETGVRFQLAGGRTSVKYLLENSPGTEKVGRKGDERSQDTLILNNAIDGVGDFTISSGSVNDFIPDQSWSARWVKVASGAPPGSVTTNLQYRLRVHNDGNSANFWCGDYEISLSSESSGGAVPYLTVYDNLGGRTDGGFDDDLADDSDIYLDWRSTNSFNGQDPNQKWYVYVSDSFAGDAGYLGYIEFHVFWEAPASKPDLQAPTYNVKAATVSEGDAFWVQQSVYNAGPGDAGSSHIRLYLSTDNDFDISDDYYLGEKAVGALAAGGDQLVQWDFVMPAIGLVSGSYDVWLLAVVDSRGEVTETDENNAYKSLNVAFVATNAPVLPDLQAPTYNVKASTVSEGDAFWVQQSVYNDGPGDAGGSHVRLYLSTDNDFDISDDYYLGEKTVGALAAGGGQLVQWDFTMPAIGLVSGSYDVWVLAVVDSQGEVTETDENNVYKSNSSAFIVHVPLATPDISVSPPVLIFQR